MLKITIDNKLIEVDEGTTILEASRKAGIYIPVLCSHPDLKPFRSLELSEKIYQGKKVFENDPGATMESVKGCGMCIVEIEGDDLPKPSCKTKVEDGMIVHTDTDKLRNKRQQNLIPILAIHPHSCLTCSQREGCIIASGDCSNSVIKEERCCELDGNCEIQRVIDYVGVAPETPKFHHPGIEKINDGSLFIRDYNLCISCGRCVRACQQIRGVYALGAVIHNGKLVIGTVNGPTLSEAECRFCGACVEVCPTGAMMDVRKPRLKDLSDYVPCRANCPGDTDIPAYLKFIADGDYQKSAEVISARLSFPNSLGKVCFHPCEVDCRRNTLSMDLNNKPGAVNIRVAKDFAMSNSKEVPIPKIEKSTGKSVSIIGGGPAGLTTGFFLSLKGHKVTIYEKEEKLGGMLRYGIPRYRLPEETLEKDLHRLLQSGMEVKTNVKVGKDITISSLLSNGSDAVYLATGLSKSRKLPLSNSGLSNIYWGVEFLNTVAKGKITANYFKSKEIVVIGGGNVATDAARTAVRLGALKTTIVCLEKANEMPAYQEEINEAKDEGITIHNGWGIIDILESETEKLNIQLKKCTSVFDEKGIFSPSYDEEIKDSITTDAVILCIGQQSDISIFSNGENKILQRGLIKTINGSYKTDIDGLFAGGDIVSGPASVIDAVGSGKQAAREIDLYLGGSGIISGDEDIDYGFDAKIGKIEGFSLIERFNPKLLDAEIRKTNFDAVEFSFEESIAQKETARCLQCNLRMDIQHNPYPPVKFLEFNYNNIEKIDAVEGVIQLLNAEKEVFLIKGSDNMKETLLNFLQEGKEANYFTFEFDPLFSKRESELVQQYLQKHGEMPDSGDDLDDLF